MTFARQFAGAVEEFAELLGIPPATVAAIKALLAAYEAAFTKCESPNAGKIDREDRKEKHAALEKDIRKIKRAYIDADPIGVVTNEIRLSFGLPLLDPNRTPVPTPSTEVVFILENSAYLQIAVRHPPKPDGYNGAVAFYTVGGPDPVTREQLTKSKLLTRSHETLTFGEDDIGKTLHIALRWQNGKGELGPWPLLQSIVIR